MKGKSKGKTVNTSRSHAILAGNQGVTMVETLVAFTVLMVVLGILYSIISFCNTLRMRAQDTNQAVVTFGEQMYNQENIPDGDNSANHISIKSYSTVGKKEPLFYLSISKDTDELNYGTAGKSYYDMINPNLPDDATNQQKKAVEDSQKALWISMVRIGAIAYSYLPTDAEVEEKIIIPKAIKFIHREDP